MTKRLKQADLAKQLRCSRQAVSAHLQRDDAPRPDRQGRYDADEVSAYVKARRGLDNRATSADLLEARIQNLKLDNQLLRQRLRIDRPAFPPEIVEALLGEFLNECHLETISALNNIAYVLAHATTPGACLKLLHEAQYDIERKMCMWMEEHKLTAPNLSKDWPIPHSSFGWWWKGDWRFQKVPGEPTPEPVDSPQ